MILLFCYGAACSYSDESCFIFEMHLQVDYSKIMVYKALLKRFFSVEIERSKPSSLSEQHS